MVVILQRKTKIHTIMKRAIRILSMLLKLGIIVCVSWGVALCMHNPTAFMPHRTIWMYFTIQSNLWIAAMALIGLIISAGRLRPGRWYSVLQLVFTISITLTGLIYALVLAPAHDDNAYGLCSILTHILVPIMANIDFFLCATDYQLRDTDNGYVIIPPLLYYLFTILAYVMGWRFANGLTYPYFFLDYSSPVGLVGASCTSPYLGVLLYVILITLGILCLGCCYIALAQLIKRCR